MSKFQSYTDWGTDTSLISNIQSYKIKTQVRLLSAMSNPKDMKVPYLCYEQSPVLQRLSYWYLSYQ